MRILIVTMPGDIHAQAVRWAIEQLGGSADFLYPADLCDGARWNLSPKDQKLSVAYAQQRDEFVFGDYTTVWMRRPPAILAQEHIDDRTERAITESDFGTLAQSIYALLERDRFVVNPIDRSRRAGLKPFQLAIAEAVGLKVPRTFTGNSPEAILAFYEQCSGDIVFKPFGNAVWQTGSGPRMVPTTRLSRELLQRSDLAAAPGIFQERIDKRSEIRATIMGRSIFAWEKRFDGRDDDLDVDWRFMFKGARHVCHHLPPAVEAGCYALLDALGLVFGCFDFVIDDAGTYYFLEVNPQGQWLAGDTAVAEINQLEAMAEFLMSGNPQFRYSERNALCLDDYRSADPSARTRADDGDHYGHLMTFMFNQSSFRVETALPARDAAGNEQRLG